MCHLIIVSRADLMLIRYSLRYNVQLTCYFGKLLCYNEILSHFIPSRMAAKHKTLY